MLKSLIIELMEYSGALRLARHIKRRQPAILMYHRIIDNSMIPGIHPDIFSEQLHYLKKHFHIMNMQQFFNAFQCNEHPDNTLVLTFDDGHADFYTHAWPRIQAEGLSATLFITTGFVDHELWLWPDLLRYILLNAKPGVVALPEVGTIDVSSGNLLHTWNRLGDYCLTLSTHSRNEFLTLLASHLGVEINCPPKTPFTAVTWEQLREMRAQGLDVGSHTVSHPILSSVDSTTLERELIDSKNRIIQELGSVPIGICYPNGMAKDISALTEQVAAQDYAYGVVAYPAKVHPSQPMHMGRIGPGNDMVSFKLKVSQLSRKDNTKGEYK